MTRADPQQLRLELLRMRASIERAELQAAVLDLRSATQPLRRALGVVSGLARGDGAGRGGIASLVGPLFALLRERPWLLSAIVTIAARRGARRWLMLGAVTAVVALLVRSMRAKAPPGEPH
jgi:hypothetical protein